MGFALWQLVDTGELKKICETVTAVAAGSAAMAAGSAQA
jgi:hypothetical protein